MHAGTLIWKFSVNCEMSKETIYRWRIRFLLFFSISASVKASEWCRSTRCRAGVSAFWQRLQKRISDLSTTFACVHPLPWRLDNDSQHFFGDLTLQTSQHDCVFFSFFLLKIAQRIGFKHPPSHMKVLSFVHMYEILRWPLSQLEAQWQIGYGVGLRIKRSSVRIRPWPLRWVLGQGSLLPLSQGEAFTLASISYLAILVKYILAKKKKKKSPWAKI